jgi:26S proteasome regulatory subunit N8
MPAAPEKVVLHPLVLLSVVDHYNRVAKDTKKRVVGVLLGETYKGTVDVTNSFAGARRRSGSRRRGVARGR